MQTHKVQGLIVEVQKCSRAVSLCNSLLSAGFLSYILPFSFFSACSSFKRKHNSISFIHTYVCILYIQYIIGFNLSMHFTPWYVFVYFTNHNVLCITFSIVIIRVFNYHRMTPGASDLRCQASKNINCGSPSG